MKTSMKKGVIVVFSNNEKEIKEYPFNTLLIKDIQKICFVNNASKDSTLDKLKEIKSFDNGSVIDVKKNKGVKAAIKAGVRYLINNEDLQLIIYLEFYKNNNFANLDQTLNLIIDSNKKIIDLFTNTNNRTMLQNVFSSEQLINKLRFEKIK
jgi:hypothetical protein